MSLTELFMSCPDGFLTLAKRIRRLCHAKNSMTVNKENGVSQPIHHRNNPSTEINKRTKTRKDK